MSKSIEERRAYQRGYYQKRKLEIGGYYKKKRADYYEDNKDSYSVRSKNWYSDPANKMKRRQKIHKVDFDKMLSDQNNLCSIGGEPLPEKVSDIHIDHDHKTGLIRGLACRSHNVGLGMFNDDIDMLEKAAQYIIEHKIRFYNEEWRRENG